METLTTTVFQECDHTLKNGTIKDENGNISLQLVPAKVEKTVKYFGGLLEFKAKLVWTNIIIFAILHVFAVYGLWIFFTNAFKLPHLYTILWQFLLIQLSCLGVTGGAHRLYTHRAYKANQPLRIFLLACFTLTGENSMHEWVRDHRQHHKFTDTDADPHNAKRGFFFSHMGWLMMQKRPAVVQKGKVIDMSDLERDSHVMFQKRHLKKLFFSLNILTMLVPYYYFGCPLWDSFFTTIFRLVYVWNGTWCVNSVAHLYGNKPFDKNIMPSENKTVSVITGGEGWHNYHHVFPWDYRASELGTKFNTTGKFIDFCARRGWAYDLKEPSYEMVKKVAARLGDGSYEPQDPQRKAEFRKTRSDTRNVREGNN